MSPIVYKPVFKKTCSPISYVRACSSIGGKAKGVSVEVAAHVLKLLEESLPAAVQQEADSGAAATLLTGALRHAMGLYSLSLAGPAPDFDYCLASSACAEATRAFQLSRLARFEMATPSSPSAHGLGSASIGVLRRHTDSEGRPQWHPA